MNPLAIFPLLFVAANAGVIATPGATLLAQPHATLLAAQPHATLIAQPQILTQPLAVQKTIHYASQPVVTGYSTQILKTPLSLAAAAPAVVAGIRQIGDAPQIPSTPPPLGDSPIGETPQIPQIELPSSTPAPPNGNGTSDQGSGSPQLPIPAPQTLTVAAPAVKTVAAAPQVVAAAPQIAEVRTVQAVQAPVVQTVQTVQAPVVATVRAAQAADFEPLVTKEKVLAPVRTHTQITPQLTQIQPEVTVRKVVQEVNVPVVSQIQTPVLRQVVAHAPLAFQTVAAAPALQLQQVAQVAQVQPAAVAAAPAPAANAEIIQAS